MTKILVVDDDESIQMLYAEEFTEEGYDVITCGEGSRLVDLVDRKRPDLIVMDIRLGHHDGLDLLQEIRNNAYNKPIILCTAYPTSKFDLKSIAADSFVVKSSDLRELKSAIKELADGRRLSQQTSKDNEIHRNEPMITEQMSLESWYTP